MILRIGLKCGADLLNVGEALCYKPLFGNVHWMEVDVEDIRIYVSRARPACSEKSK
jgi:hypothetical protein